MLKLLFLFSLNVFALNPQKYEWKKIETENFTVVYEKAQEKFAQQCANKAEQALKKLEALTLQKPKNTVILIDHTKDYSNGSASFFPYPIIKLQAFSPSPKQSVGQYNDWLYELLLHEITHILNFYEYGGIYRPLRFILGSIVSPAYFMPIWYLEGLAVNTESKLTSGGRLKTATYRAYQKLLIENNISFANEQDTGEFPFGASPYIYGGWILDYAYKNSPKFEEPKTAMAQLHSGFTRRLPFFINSGFKSHLGVSAYKSFREQFAEAKKSTPQSLHNNLSKSLDIKNSPTQKAQNFPGSFPQWSKDQNGLFYLRQNDLSLTELIEKKEDTEKVLFSYRSIPNFQVLKKQIYYIAPKLEEQDHYNFKLHSYDFKTKKSKDLDLNAFDFDILKQKIVFITKNLEHSFLYIAPLNNLKQKKLIAKSAIEERFAFPRFLDSGRIVYTLKAPGRDEEILKLNLKTKSSQKLKSHRNINYLQVYNNKVYYLFEEQGLRGLSHTRSSDRLIVKDGLLNFWIQNPQNVFLSELSSEGPELSKSSLDQIKSKEKPISSSDKLLQEAPTGSKGGVNTSLFQRYSSTDYSSFSHLIPNYVLPNFLVSPYGFSGAFLYGLSTGSQDPLGLNSYSVSALSDTVSKRLSYGLNYRSRHLRTPISFSIGESSTPLSTSLTKVSRYAQLGASYQHNSNFGESYVFGLSLLGDQSSSKLNGSGSGSGGSSGGSSGSQKPPRYKRGGVSLSFSYLNSDQQARELSPKEGWDFSLVAQHFFPLASDYIDYNTFSLGARKYFASPFFSSHRLVLGLDAQIYGKRLPFIFAVNSLNQPYSNSGMGAFTLRGVPTGAFFSLEGFASAHLEYHFPLINFNWGPGLLPAFLNRLTASLVADYAHVKGANLIDQVFIDEKTPLYSAGLELNFEAKLFYHVPAKFQLGLYQFLNQEVYSGGPTLFVGFGIQGLPF